MNDLIETDPCNNELLIPNKKYINLLFTNDEFNFRKFYWVKMNNNNLYWGSFYKFPIYCQKLQIIGDTITITKDESNIIAPNEYYKFSYHESGDFHWKNKNNFVVDKFKWSNINKIEKPTLIFSTISKKIDYYNNLIFNMKNYNIIFSLENEVCKDRIYFEFFFNS